MTAFNGDNLTGRIEVDGNQYDKCRFSNGTLVYRGGQPPRLVGCTFTGFSIEFLDSAANTLTFMTMMQAGGFSSVIEPTLDNIRRAKP